MKQFVVRLLIVLVLTLGMTFSLQAQSLDEAARQAARQYNAKVLSARTVQEGNKRVHVIKLLTQKGVVKTVRVTVKER
jgi:cell division protein YceG involved in septum cleavage